MNNNEFTAYWRFNHKHILLPLRKTFYLCLTLNLVACNTVATRPPSSQIPPSPKQQYTVKPTYTCQHPQSYAGTVVGDGECVSLIKLCSQAPDTAQWSGGEKVLSKAPGSITPGTIIATFKNGKYPSTTGYHAAIYISHSNQGIWVWDQWAGKAVHQRLIRVRHDKAAASNSAQAYRIVR